MHESSLHVYLIAEEWSLPNTCNELRHSLPQRWTRITPPWQFSFLSFTIKWSSPQRHRGEHVWPQGNLFHMTELKPSLIILFQLTFWQCAISSPRRFKVCSMINVNPKWQWKKSNTFHLTCKCFRSSVILVVQYSSYQYPELYLFLYFILVHISTYV